jgi:ubiquinone/menaquinone biosynthesis C-methylase UbiE
MFADAYDANADHYCQHAERLVYRHLARPLAAALIPAVGPVLDVAGGTGAFGRQVGAVAALDISARQLDHHPARMRVRGDAERLPFAADTFAVAGCAFGINHFPDAAMAVREMARVAPVVGVITWKHPESRPYLPRQAVEATVRRRFSAADAGSARVAEELSNRTGSVTAVRALLTDAGLVAHVQEVTVHVPWPGPSAFVDYRLGLTDVVPANAARAEIHREAVAAVAALDPDAFTWCPRLVLGVGRRP